MQHGAETRAMIAPWQPPSLSFLSSNKCVPHPNPKNHVATLFKVLSLDGSQLEHAPDPPLVMK
jgi:hypothetical protein